ncbi:MAG: low molecular weight phosphotyrosine protein phosphatase [Alphaproteobacteria bacterium]|nr:MAG: low molecular weight phosphotyrosine protein phosphatase [Alphaproteobacteria bacterium]
MAPIRVLFVCMGNICRSPMAEGVFADMVARAGLSHAIEIDSAGTSGWHEDEGADQRAVAAATSRGYDISFCRSRPINWRDYGNFDYILAMDDVNLRTLRSEASEDLEDKISLFMRFADGEAARSVPDPYGGDAGGFDLVMDMVEEGAAALLAHIQKSDL